MSNNRIVYSTKMVDPKVFESVDKGLRVETSCHLSVIDSLLIVHQFAISFGWGVYFSIP